MRKVVRKRRVVVASALVLSVGVGLLWWARPPTQRSPIAEGDGPPATDVLRGWRGEVVGIAGVHRGAAGAVLGRYDLSYAMQLEAPAARPGGGQGKGVMTLRGLLELTPAATPGWLVGRISGAKVTSDPSITAQMGAAEDAPGRGFDAVFGLRIADNGAIAELRHAANAPAGARRLLSGLLRAVQIVRDAEDTASPWQITEPGPDGDRDVTYSVRGSRQDTRVTKSWYVRQLAGKQQHGSASGAAPMEARGDVQMRLTDGQLQRATYTLVADADLGFGVGAARYHGEVQATLVRLPTASPDVAWSLLVDPTTLEAGSSATRVRVPRPKINVAASATVESLSIAASAAAYEKNTQARRSAMQQLAVLIQQDPSQAARVASLIRTPTPGVGRRTLVEALASSDTAAGKAELVKLLDDDEVSAEARADVATVATFMTHPGDELLDSLTLQSQSAGQSRLATASLWALAAQSRLQADRQHALSERLHADVLRRAKLALNAGAGGDAATSPVASAVGGAPTTPISAFRAAAMAEGAVTANGLTGADVVTSGGGTSAGSVSVADHPTPGSTASEPEIDAWLDALGTLGTADVLPLVRPWLKHPDHKIRMTAVFALRFVHTPAARIEIINTMALDQDGWVRRSAVFACRYHPMKAFLAPVRRALREDVHPNVRLAAAYNLSMWSNDAPTLMADVRKAAVREPKPLVRRAMLDLEPMLFRDRPDGSVTMEPVLAHGKPGPSVPKGVILVERQKPETAQTAEGALPSAGGGKNAESTDNTENTGGK